MRMFVRTHQNSPLPGDIFSLHAALEGTQRYGAGQTMLDRVDAEVLNLRAVIAGLNKHRNDRVSLLSAINFSEDVLVLIFHSVVESEEWNPYKSTLLLARVCSHWRSVVLSQPVLWAKINNRWRDKTNLLLERSNRAPLRVAWMNSAARDDLEYMGKILQCLDRVRELHLTLTPEVCINCDLQSRLAAGIAPLESLSLTSELGYQEFDKMPCPQSSTLRELTLRCVSLPWSTSLDQIHWPSLTKLHINDYPPPCYFPLTVLISILQQLCSLTSLFLRNASGSDQKDDVCAPLAELPHLRELSVDGADATFALVLANHLIVPSNCIVSCNAFQLTRSIPARAVDFKTIFPLSIRSTTPTHAKFHLTELGRHVSNNSISMTAEKVTDDRAEKWSASLNFSRLDEQSYEQFPSVFLGMFEDVSQVQYLQIDKMSWTAIARFLPRLNNVKTVVLTLPSVVRDFARVLDHGLEITNARIHHKTARDHSILTPSLEGIYISSDITKSEALPLIEALRRRKRAGFGLLKITLVGPSLSKEHLSEIPWDYAAKEISRSTLD